MNKPQKETTVKYLNLLNTLKHHLDNSDFVTITGLADRLNILNEMKSWLIKNGVIYKDVLGVYKWNQKIPVTHLLIKKYRLDKSKRNAKRKAKRIEMADSQQTLFEQQKPIKTRKIAPIQKTNEYGVIRRFLKWLW